jgi:hypothetical protein
VSLDQFKECRFCEASLKPELVGILLLLDLDLEINLFVVLLFAKAVSVNSELGPLFQSLDENLFDFLTIIFQKRTAASAGILFEGFL